MYGSQYVREFLDPYYQGGLAQTVDSYRLRSHEGTRKVAPRKYGMSPPD
jgi:hypothetical protein